jgi:hypothetical protein
VSRPTTGAAHGECYLNCPRCGLTITPRFPWLAMRHCPRCLARNRTIVELFSSGLPAAALYADGSVPQADGNGSRRRNSARRATSDDMLYPSDR